MLLLVEERRVSSETCPGSTFFIGCHPALISKPRLVGRLSFVGVAGDKLTLEAVDGVGEIPYSVVHVTSEDGLSGSVVQCCPKARPVRLPPQPVSTYCWGISQCCNVESAEDSQVI